MPTACGNRQRLMGSHGMCHIETVDGFADGMMAVIGM
jgi:hypothetical protein